MKELLRLIFGKETSHAAIERLTEENSELKRSIDNLELYLILKCQGQENLTLQSKYEGFKGIYFHLKKLIGEDHKHLLP